MGISHCHQPSVPTPQSKCHVSYEHANGTRLRGEDNALGSATLGDAPHGSSSRTEME